jgi:hypothetical protein
MPINYIPNDANAGSTAPGIRSQTKRPNRPASRASFTFIAEPAEGEFEPGTPEFLFWQSREAALAALDAWEGSVGPHTNWQGNRKKIPLLPDQDEDLNAFYDRDSFSFFHKTVGGTTFFSGESTDVVAHEVGHGLLDSVRPEFFDVNFLEVGAFHEAFGDCTALLTALSDSDSRKKLLDVTTTLGKRNFVETTAEQLSLAIGKFIPGHNASEPRHAFNKLKFVLPQTLPDNGGPGELLDEVHSFGMIFTGCFWDTLINMFGAASSKTEATLLKTAQKLFAVAVAGAKAAVITPRFLQSVGRAMVLADQSMNGGANRDHIRNGFLAHDILLGTNTMVAPTMSLAGAAPKRGAISPATKKDILNRLGGEKGAKMNVVAHEVFGETMAKAIHKREIPLGSVDKVLKGVVAVGLEPVLVGESGGHAAVMGAVPNPVDTESEVRSFVESLLKHDRIEIPGTRRGAVASTKRSGKPTHAVKSVGGKKVLQRIRFQCFGHCGC